MPDLYFSERNLLDAIREGKIITEAELTIVLERLTRVRAEREGLREALEAIWRKPITLSGAHAMHSIADAALAKDGR